MAGSHTKGTCLGCGHEQQFTNLGGLKMGMFDFFSMGDNYEERVVDHYEGKKLVVDTCYVSDSEKDYETGICHPDYNDNQWVIVELYNTKKEAQIGHDKWVKKMKTKLPDKLIDVSSAEIVGILDCVAGEDNWRTYKRIKKQ